VFGDFFLAGEFAFLLGVLGKLGGLDVVFGWCEHGGMLVKAGVLTVVFLVWKTCH
jgi:hypothetical protein